MLYRAATAVALLAVLGTAAWFWSRQFSAVILQGVDGQGGEDAPGVYVAQFMQPGGTLVYSKAAELPLDLVPTAYTWLSWGVALWNRRTQAKGAVPATLLQSVSLGGGLSTWVVGSVSASGRAVWGQLLPAGTSPTQGLNTDGAHRWAPVPATGNSTLPLLSTQVGVPPGTLLASVLVVDTAAAAATAGAPPTAANTLTQLLTQPVTCALFAVFGFIFYRLFREQWPASAVVNSAATLLQKREYWRAITAALSHQAIMHLAMNSMSLYNLAFVEPAMGSAVYAVTTAQLIVVVEVVDSVARWALARRPGMEVHWVRPHLGFSGVLFAWMMVATAQLPTFCPVPFLPVCVPTLDIPLPFAIQAGGLGYRLPINFGPFILLGLIQLLVPQSSFLGHASGIVGGLVVLWGGLSWLTPSLFAAMLVAAAWLHSAALHRSTAVAPFAVRGARQAGARSVDIAQVSAIASTKSHASWFAPSAASVTPAVRFSSSGTLAGGHVDPVPALAPPSSGSEWKALQGLAAGLACALAAGLLQLLVAPAPAAAGTLLWSLCLAACVVAEAAAYFPPTGNGEAETEAQPLAGGASATVTAPPTLLAQIAAVVDHEPQAAASLLLGCVACAAVAGCEATADLVSLSIAAPALLRPGVFVSSVLDASTAVHLMQVASALLLLSTAAVVCAGLWRLVTVHHLDTSAYGAAILSGEASETRSIHRVSGGGGRQLV